ncbi:hypothetical protein P4H65_27820, partial [Paenibacillus chitinolyticus]|uniref:hypothetical protein n=1 Tax=Paenibacillus chitinolyticus TaxID=79263 RepID=UPI002DBA9175
AVPRWIGAELAAGFVQPKADRVRYTGGTAYIRDGRLRVEMTGSGNRPSALWEGLLGANCLIRQRERELPGPGGTVDLMLTDAVGIR